MKNKPYLTLGEYISNHGDLSILAKLSNFIGKTISLPVGNRYSSSRYWIPQWYIQDIDYKKGKVIIRKVITIKKGSKQYRDTYGNLESTYTTFGVSISIEKPKEYELKIKENGRIKIGTYVIGTRDVEEYQPEISTYTYMRMYD